MSESHTVTYSFEIDIAKARADAKELEQAFDRLEQTALRYLAIVRRMGLPDDARMVLDTLARTVVVLRQAQMTATAFAVASGPIGWAFALGGLGLTTMSAGDLMMDLG